MNIVLLGAGTIGTHLASVLSQEGHSVIVVDRDPKALEKISQTADIATRLGSGTDCHLLEEIKEFSPDFFIAMSNDDETNLVACSLAKNLGYPKTVARIRQNTFLDKMKLDLSHLFGVDHIMGTELIIAHDILKCILNPGNLAVENFAHGAVQMRTIVIPERFGQAGKPLAQMNLLDNLLVGLIRRKTDLIFPKGQDLLLPGYEATVIGKASTMNNLHSIFDIPKKTVKSAVLIGGSGVAMHLTRLLEEQNINVKIIEQDENKCMKLARLFPNAIILNYDGTHLDVLKEERVYNADVFIACTQSHETNILAAMLGKQVGCKEVIASVSDESVIPLLEHFDIAYTLSERTSITRRIQVILHNDTFISLASLYDNQAKIMEVKISQRSKLVGAPIADLRPILPKNFLIAMVENQQGITIPKGNNLLSPGDKAIVICGPENIETMKKIL